MILRTTRLLCRVQRVLLTSSVPLIEGGAGHREKKGVDKEHESYLYMYRKFQRVLLMCICKVLLDKGCC